MTLTACYSYSTHMYCKGNIVIISFWCYTGTFTKQLKNSTMLKSLNLKGCGLALRSAKSLAEALTVNSHLRELDIGDNEFVRDDGIQYLAQALSVNQGLKNT